MPFLAGWYRESGELAIRASLESVTCGRRPPVISDCFLGIGIFQQPARAQRRGARESRTQRGCPDQPRFGGRQNCVGVSPMRQREMLAADEPLTTYSQMDSTGQSRDGQCVTSGWRVAHVDSMAELLAFRRGFQTREVCAEWAS